MKRRIYSWFMIIIMVCSCNRNKPLDYALQVAGENETELKTVLNHFKKNPQKLKATQFLIENMPYHFSREAYFMSTKKENTGQT